MKYIKYILIFLSTISYTQHITVDQYYCIAENSGDGWDVGKFCVFPSDTALNGACTYTYTVLSGNSDGAFTVNSSTGQITINDSTQFYGEGTQEYDINILVSTSTGRSDTNIANIHIHDESKCIFIDPSWGGTESGTRAQPYDHFSDDIGSGSYYDRAYFFKAGETSGANDRYWFNEDGGNSSNQVYIAKYGASTDVFTFSSTAGHDAYGFFIGSVTWSDTLNPTAYVNVYDIRVENYDEPNRSNFIISRATNNIYLNRCEAYHGAHNGEYYFEENRGIDDPVIYALFCWGSDNTNSHVFKATSKLVRLYGCHAGNCVDNNAFDLVANAGYDSWGEEVYGCYHNGNSSRSVYARSRNSEISYSAFNGGYRQIEIDSLTSGEGPNNVYIHHNKIYGNSYASSTVYMNFSDSLVIENNEFVGNGSNRAIGVYDTRGLTDDNDNVYIRNNIIHGFGNEAIYITDYNNSNINIEGNVIYDNGSDGVYSLNSDVHILGNTIVKNTGYDINNQSGGDIELRGNIYEDRTGSFNPYSNNHDNDNEDSFTDYINNDFTIPDSMLFVVDNGYDYGQVVDILGNVISGDYWDIGAYEYQYTIGEESVDTILFTDSINFTITGYPAAGWTNVVQQTWPPDTIDLGMGVSLIPAMNYATSGAFDGNGYYEDEISNTFHYKVYGTADSIYHITGLNPDSRYKFTFYSYRSSDVSSGERISYFKIGNDSVWVNSVGNTDSLLYLYNIQSDALGNIDIHVRNTPGYAAYFNAMVIEEYYGTRVSSPLYKDDYYYVLIKDGELYEIE